MCNVLVVGLLVLGGEKFVVGDGSWSVGLGVGGSKNVFGEESRSSLSNVRLWCLFLGLLVLSGGMVQGEFVREGRSVVVSVLSRGE